MWQDALRVCKEYVPHKLQAMQDEYEREMIGNSKRSHFMFLFISLSKIVPCMHLLCIDVSFCRLGQQDRIIETDVMSLCVGARRRWCSRLASGSRAASISGPSSAMSRSPTK